MLWIMGRGAAHAQAPRRSRRHSEPSASASRVFPLHWANRLPHLSVTINEIRGYLVLDTGLQGRGALFADRAEALGVTLTPGPVLRNREELVIAVTGCEEGSCPISGVTGGGRHVFTRAMSSWNLDGKPVFGIVGIASLRESGAVLDFAGQVIRFLPGDAGLAGSGREAIALVDSRSGHWQAPVRIQGRACLMKIDTGANITVLTESLANALGVAVSDRSPDSIRSFGSLSGSYAVLPSLGLGEALSVNNLRVLVSPISFPDQGEMPVGGILGTDVLVAERMVLDCGRGILHVGKPGGRP